MIALDRELTVEANDASRPSPGCAPRARAFWIADTWHAPATDPMELNLYAYCKSDPIGFTDPTGHFGIADIGITAGIIGVLSTISLGTLGGVLFHHGGVLATVKGIAYGALGGSALGLAFAEGGPARFGEALGTGLVYAGIYAIEDFLAQAGVNAIHQGGWSGAFNNIDTHHVEQKAFSGFNIGAGVVGYGQWLADELGDENGIAESALVGATTFVDDIFSSFGNGQSTVGNIISAGIDASVQTVLTLFLANRVDFLEGESPEMIDQIKKPIENIITGMTKAVVNEFLAGAYIEGLNVFGQELVAWAQS